MDQVTLTRTTTCLLLFISSYSYVFFSSLDKTMYTSNYYAASLALALLLLFLIVFAVRTTVVTWITVMVLLAFSGKRRRVLVKEGRKITSDVAKYLALVVVKERPGLVAFACAAAFGLVTMACL